MSATQPLTGDELAAIKAAALNRRYPNEFEVPRLVAEVERLTGSLEVALARLAQDGHPEDRNRMAALHIEAALAGASRPFALANAEVERLRAKVEQARTWIGNCVDPAEVSVEVKQQMLDALTP